jgi:hypothetical protein
MLRADALTADSHVAKNLAMAKDLGRLGSLVRWLSPWEGGSP